jgi:predicted regulator of amino acid metabolism with ACT domain
MSAQERRLLKDCELSFSEAADYLGVTRQSVTRGIEGKTPYLTPDRIAKIFAKLQVEKSDEVAAQFRRAVIDRLKIDEGTFERVPTQALRDRISEGHGAAYNADEVWLFSSRPRELYLATYLSQMKKQIYTVNQKSKIKRFIYFVPPDIAPAISRAIQEALKEIADQTIHIQIVESTAVQLSPHFIITNPRTLPSGFVMGETEDRFFRMPASRTSAIMEYLIKAGIGVHSNKLILGDQSGARRKDMAQATPEFRLCFDSREDPQVSAPEAAAR